MLQKEVRRKIARMSKEGYREQTMQYKASRVNTSSEDRESFLC